MDMDISMDIHAKSVDMDMDMDGKFHIHGNPVLSAYTLCQKLPSYSEALLLSFTVLQ